MVKVGKACNADKADIEPTFSAGVAVDRELLTTGMTEVEESLKVGVAAGRDPLVINVDVEVSGAEKEATSSVPWEELDRFLALQITVQLSELMLSGK